MCSCTCGRCDIGTPCVQRLAQSLTCTGAQGAVAIPGTFMKVQWKLEVRSHFHRPLLGGQGGARMGQGALHIGVKKYHLAADIDGGPDTLVILQRRICVGGPYGVLQSCMAPFPHVPSSHYRSSQARFTHLIAKHLLAYSVN